MAGGLHSSWPAKINGVSYEEKHSRGGETREENEEVARMCSPTADVKGGRRIFAGWQTTTEKKAVSGCSRRRCSCSSATTGKGEMDAARCRGYCGGVVLFRGRLDAVD
jgi:hypothetical protein